MSKNLPSYLTENAVHLEDFSVLECWYSVTDISGQSLGSIFKDEGINCSVAEAWDIFQTMKTSRMLLFSAIIGVCFENNINCIVWKETQNLGSGYIPLQFIQCPVCLTTGPQSLAKRAAPGKQHSASFFELQYRFVSLRSSNSCLRLLPRLPVSSFLPSNFLSLTYFWRQFLHQVWPFRITFLLLYCKILSILRDLQ